MKALVYRRYGGPETHRIEEREAPEPGAGQVRIRVSAVGLNPWDWHIYRGDPWLARVSFGLRRPGERIVGADVAGVVDAVGAEVPDLVLGDRVFGFVGFGGCAELVCADATAIARTPATLTDIEASALPIAAVTALGGLEDGGGCAGRRVLVIGASGGVGHFAVQIARALGASRVVAVCSGPNAGMVDALGADRVIDYTREDVCACGETFDVVFDTVGTTSLRGLAPLLARTGVYLPAGGLSAGALLGPARTMFGARLAAPFVRRRVVPVGTPPTTAHLDRLATWHGESALRAVIAATYPWERSAEAFTRLEAQHVAGKLVLTLE